MSYFKKQALSYQFQFLALEACKARHARQGREECEAEIPYPNKKANHNLPKLTVVWNAIWAIQSACHLGKPKCYVG